MQRPKEKAREVKASRRTIKAKEVARVERMKRARRTKAPKVELLR